MPTPKAVSLHCTVGTSDKLYDMQLLPQPDGTWTVTAQHGRRGSTLKHLVKLKGATFHAASRKFDELLNEKLHVKHYFHVPPHGVSALPLPTSVPAPATAVKSVPVPSWTGALDNLAETATFMGLALTLVNHPDRAATKAALVLMGDLANGLQDGIADAVALGARSPGKVLDNDVLSPECRAWLDEVPVTTRNQLLSHVQELCQAV